MDQYHGEETPGPQVYEGRISAKERCICELQEGPKEGSNDGRMGMGDAEFVEVMDVSETEYYRREEYSSLVRGLSEDEKGN